jgi:hypothetical protein
MPSHKVLPAVAHNFGHSFLSLGSWYLETSWPVQHLFMAARDAGEATVRINLLDGRIAPASVTSKRLNAALRLIPDSFRNTVERSGASIEFVRSAEMSVTFRFDEKKPGKPAGHSFGAGVIIPEMVSYDATVMIVDDRGVTHEATVPEWWRN